MTETDATPSPGVAPSKTQRKRDMADLRELGERLASLPEHDIREVADEQLREAALEYRRINKGNAKKRQLQYIGKLLRRTDVNKIRALIERKDASKLAHKTAFHQLERWRTLLLEDFVLGVDAVASTYPNVDRQQLRSLTRQVAREVASGSSEKRHYRRLFQFLRDLANSATDDPDGIASGG